MSSLCNSESKVWTHFYKIWVFLFKMSLPTPRQSVSHKRFHKCVNHRKKLSLRHPSPTFGSFRFFHASLWFGVDKVLQKLTKSYKSDLRHLFQCCILIPRKCPRKIPFQHTVPPPSNFSDFPPALFPNCVPWNIGKKVQVCFISNNRGMKLLAAKSF